MTPNLMILYVADTVASAAFYADLFGQKPRALSPGYAAFVFDNGLSLGLLSKASTALIHPHGDDASELAFMVAGDAAVEACYRDWQDKGLTFVQPLTRFEFGPTFVALDPDGHRLRVCLIDE
ncbi:VOC family protein [Rhizobium sp. SG2393]|uniref:VOC family protein n=1 Tax=Rhizobium sp. SG2393 TaxID=3276279 RepID=UPI00366CE576